MSAACKPLEILGRPVGPGHPTYVVAEISCNHNGRLEEAVAIIHAARDGGADAVKLQTYTPDTISRSLRTPAFKVKGTMWEGQYMGDLYARTQTPYSWHQVLKETALAAGLHWFSSPFDESAVDLLQSLDVPAFKIASFEVVDLPLLRCVAATGKPVIMSTGMTTLAELDEAVCTLRDAGNTQLALLHCNSGYPAPFDEANLATIPVLQQLYGVPVGLSDHTLWADDAEGERQHAMPHVSPALAVSLGASLVEVHLLMDRTEARTLHANGVGGFDWPFSRTPGEFRQMVTAIRQAEKSRPVWTSQLERTCADRAMGTVRTGPTPREMGSRRNRPSLMVTRDVKAGQVFRFQGGGRVPDGNVDSIRPGGGLHTRYAGVVDGAVAQRDVAAGTPLEWEHLLVRGGGGAP